MTGISAISIGVNSVFKRLEYEKLAKYCCIKVKKVLGDLGVKSSLETLRIVFDELYFTNPSVLQSVLFNGTFIYYLDLPCDYSDLRFSKEILTVYEIEKRRNKVRNFESEEDKDQLSCFQIILKTFSSESEDNGQVLPEIQNVDKEKREDGEDNVLDLGNFLDDEENKEKNVFLNKKIEVTDNHKIVYYLDDVSSCNQV